MKKLILLSMLLLNFSHIYSQDYILTSEEKKSIKEFTETVSIEDSIGQILAVGYPTDINRYKIDEQVNKILIEDIGIGFVFINSFNYYYRKDDINTSEEEENLLKKIQDFNNKIIKSSLNNNMKIPTFFAINFEGYEYKSIRKPLISPPEALTLASTNDTKIIYDIGKSIGHQLDKLGIHLLLGPVFDVASVSDSKHVMTIQNRTFGGSPDIIESYTSYFAKGIQEYNVKLISKHFPGHGDVFEDPHNLRGEIPESRFNLCVLESQIRPYKTLKSYIDGIMTAHINITALPANYEKFVTVSNLLVKNFIREKNIKINGIDYDGLGLNDQVIMTDDISDMGAVYKYIDKHNISYEDFVISCFNAGHDIILLSIIELELTGPNQTSFTHSRQIDLKKVISIKNSLLEFIGDNTFRVKQFRESLYRVLLLKASYGKKRGISVNDFLNGNSNSWLTTSKLRDIQEIQSKNNYEKISDLYDEVYKKSYIEVSKNIDYDLSKLATSSNITFFSYEDYVDYYKTSLRSKFPTIKIIPLKRKENSESYLENKKEALKNSLNEDDIVIMHLYRPEDANIINGVIPSSLELIKKKLIILAHNTPSILDHRIILSSTIIGNFSKNPRSFELDCDLLMAKIKANPIHYLTISLGSNGKIYNHLEIERKLKVSDGSNVQPILISALEKILHFKYNKQKEQIENLNNEIKTLKDSKQRIKNLFIAFLIIFIIILLVSITLFIFSIKRSNTFEKRRENIFSKIIGTGINSTFFICLFIVGYKFLNNSDFLNLLLNNEDLQNNPILNFIKENYFFIITIWAMICLTLFYWIQRLLLNVRVRKNFLKILKFLMKKNNK